VVIDDPPPRRDAEEFAEAVSPAHDHIGLPAAAAGRLAARADRGPPFSAYRAAISAGSGSNWCWQGFAPNHQPDAGGGVAERHRWAGADFTCKSARPWSAASSGSRKPSCRDGALDPKVDDPSVLSCRDVRLIMKAGSCQRVLNTT
jgi:hypothetical protein